MDPNIVAIVSSGIALFVAISSALIGINQYRVSHAKLKFDLFEKRYEIFIETWEVLTRTVMEPEFKTWKAAGTPFNNLIPKASFLFGKRIEKYLDEARNKWIDLWEISLATETAGGVVPPESIAKRADLMKWFQNEGQWWRKA